MSIRARSQSHECVIGEKREGASLIESGERHEWMKGECTGMKWIMVTIGTFPQVNTASVEMDYGYHRDGLLR